MNKRTSLLLLSLTALFLFSGNTCAQKLSVHNLTVEHQINPLSVDNPEPRFSWKMSAVQQNTKQNSYEIKLATSPDLKGKNVSIFGKSNDQSVLIPYQGPALNAKTSITGK